MVAEPPEKHIPFFIASLPTKDRFEGAFDKYVLGFYFGRGPSLELGVPFWFFVLIGLAVTVAPWIRHLSWQFSLRALLIAATVVAVGLGVVIWAARN
jgi:hypothetical protein